MFFKNFIVCHELFEVFLILCVAAVGMIRFKEYAFLPFQILVGIVVFQQECGFGIMKQLMSLFFFLLAFFLLFSAFSFPGLKHLAGHFRFYFLLQLDLGEFNEDVQRVLAAIIAARGSTS